MFDYLIQKITVKELKDIKPRKKQKFSKNVKKFTKVEKKCRVRGGGGQKSTPFRP